MRSSNRKTLPGQFGVSRVCAELSVVPAVVPPTFTIGKISSMQRLPSIAAKIRYSASSIFGMLRVHPMAWPFYKK